MYRARGRTHAHTRARFYVKGLALLLTALLAAAMLMSGCSVREGQNQQGYGDDGYLGLSNSNPNLHTHSTHYHYDDDFRLVREALASFTEIRDMRITINGGILRVRLKLVEGLNQSRAEDIEFQARDALEQQLPRYKLKISTNYSQ